MAVYNWTLQGSIPTTISLSDSIQLAGSVFNSPLFVGNYQDGTFVKTAGGLNKSLGNLPVNTKYIDSTHYSLNGGASTLLDATHPANSDCSLFINFTHGSSVAITNHIIYAYNGLDVAVGPVNATLKIASKADTLWKSADGNINALMVADRTANTSHDFYFLISGSPTDVGLSSGFVLRDELIYS